MSFGLDTVTFVHLVESGTEDEFGDKPLVEETINAPGCRHRPLTPKETAEIATNIATELWKTTIPLHEYGTELVSELLSIESDDTIRVDGVTYHIIGGDRPFKDMDTGYFKMTIHSEKRRG